MLNPVRTDNYLCEDNFQRKNLLKKVLILDTLSYILTLGTSWSGDFWQICVRLIYMPTVLSTYSRCSRQKIFLCCNTFYNSRQYKLASIRNCLRMDSSFNLDNILESTLTELENNFLQKQQHLQERMYCIYCIIIMYNNYIQQFFFIRTQKFRRLPSLFFYPWGLERISKYF